MILELALLDKWFVTVSYNLSDLSILPKAETAVGLSLKSRGKKFTENYVSVVIPFRHSVKKL